MSPLRQSTHISSQGSNLSGSGISNNHKATSPAASLSQFDPAKFIPSRIDGDSSLIEFPVELLEDIRQDCIDRRTTAPSCCKGSWNGSADNIFLSKGRPTVFVEGKPLRKLECARFTWPGKQQIVVVRSTNLLSHIIVFHKLLKNAVIFEGKEMRQCIWRVWEPDWTEEKPFVKILRLIDMTELSTYGTQPEARQRGEETPRMSHDKNPLYRPEKPSTSIPADRFFTDIASAAKADSQRGKRPMQPYIEGDEHTAETDTSRTTSPPAKRHKPTAIPDATIPAMTQDASRSNIEK
ncbi:hypothetical protein LTR66_016803 [Elasticomyces elasticus]|nr:hypothetical protein LTR66_016803 [Elasticomyces elasticus]